MNAHLVQGSPEWFAARLGKLTASEAATIMGGLKTDGLASYVMDLAWERVHGARDAGYQSAAMKRGQQLEPEARGWYEFNQDCEVELVGLIDHPRVPWCAASPDARRPGRVVEIKCLLHRAWMEVQRTRQVPSAYRWQTRWQMWCTGEPACDFVAYHPAAGGLIVPCEVTPAEIEQMTERAYVVNAMVDEWVATLRTRKAA